MLKKTLWITCGLLYLAYIVAPILLMILGSFGEKWFGTLLPQGMTLQWYSQLFSQTMYLRALRTSLFVASASVGLNALISVPAVYAVHMMGSPRLRSIMNMMILLPIAVPPVVMGLGMIQAFNWENFSLVGTWQLLLGAHVVYTLPFMIRPLMANMESIQWRTLEEAGLSLGASSVSLALKVLIPNLFPGLLSGALMTFAMSIGEFQLAVMLTGSMSQTYPVVLYQAFYVGTGFACAATTVLVAITLFTLMGVFALGKVFNSSQTALEA